MRFFGGSLSEWLATDADTAIEMAQVMEQLQAEEMTGDITVASFPHMKKEAQKKISSQLRKASQPKVEKRALSTAEVANIIKGPRGVK